MRAADPGSWCRLAADWFGRIGFQTAASAPAVACLRVVGTAAAAGRPKAAESAVSLRVVVIVGVVGSQRVAVAPPAAADLKVAGFGVGPDRVPAWRAAGIAFAAPVPAAGRRVGRSGAVAPAQTHGRRRA